MYTEMLIVSTGGVASGNVVCTPFGCVTVEALTVGLVVGATALTLLVAFGLTYLPEAQRAVGRERRRTEAERDAFGSFSRRVARLEASSAAVGEATPEGGVLSRTQPTGPTEDRLAQVRDAYRETVMAVSHYEEEYDDSLPRSMTEEFGEELATAVVRGDQFTTGLQEALLQRSQQARSERQSFLGTLDCEAAALTDAADAFERVLEALDDLDVDPLSSKDMSRLAEDWKRIRGLEADCRQVVEDRQAAVHDGYPNLPRSRDGTAFHEYIYASLPVTHPVLAEGAEVFRTLRTARGRVVRAATRHA